MMRAPVAVVAAGALLLSACSGPSQASKKSLNALLASASYDKAEAKLKSSKETEYGRKNAVLYNLDMGTVLHHAGKHQESEAVLDRAELRMRELYTKSVSKHAGMLVLNDNTVDYAGEPFERALLHVLRALNWVFMGKPEEAVVEARKVEQYLTELNEVRGGKAVYKDDAFARYLDSLLYADIGKPDDSRISFQAAKKAYEWYAKDYGVPLPQFTLPKAGPTDGEVVFIHYNGVAPRKVSKTFQVAWGQGLAAVEAEGGDDQDAVRARNAIRGGLLGNQVTVAYPDFVQDPTAVKGSRVKAGEREAETLLVEDISAIAIKDLKDRNALIRTRAIARATVKFVLAKAAGDAVTRQYGKNWGTLAKIVASGTAAATEVADTRNWTTVPGQIRMARLRLPAGEHDVTALFLDGSGRAVLSHVFKAVKVSKGRRTYLHYRTAI